MAYICMKRLILDENEKQRQGLVVKEEHAIFVTENKDKLDTFYVVGSLNKIQYEELTKLLMFIPTTKM